MIRARCRESGFGADLPIKYRATAGQADPETGLITTYFLRKLVSRPGDRGQCRKELNFPQQNLAFPVAPLGRGLRCVSLSVSWIPIGTTYSAMKL